MDQFLNRYQDRIIGVLSAPDRLTFRGTLRQLCQAEHAARWYAWRGFGLGRLGEVLKLDSQRLKENAEAMARKAGRLYEYLPSSKIAKLERAQEIARRDDIKEGLVCVFGAKESCYSFAVRKRPEDRYPELRREERAGLFLYFYFVDREFGLMHVRVQTWAPFDIQIYINGREWLARMMDKEGLGYERRENCFARLDDPKRAQQLADLMERFYWPDVFNAFARRVNPLLKIDLGGRQYYWTLRGAEYATDVMFRDEKSLAEIYPRLIRHMVQTCGAEDVLRFLGHKLTGNFKGRVETDYHRRPEGVRIRHRAYENWLKMYDKQGSVLRIETTINNAERFKIYREVNRKGKRVMAWVRMCRSVAEFYRWVEVSRGANRRYLDFLASVPEAAPSRNVLDPVSQPAFKKGQRYRALRPVAPDEAQKFASILRGEFILNGFRNADLRPLLFPDPPSTPEECKRQMTRVTRIIRLFVAHRLVRKVSHTTLYRITRRGVAVMSTAQNLRAYDVNALSDTA